MTKENLLHLFEYNREAGVLIWKNHWHPPTATKLFGKIAGNLHRDIHTVYRTVMIKGKQHCIHRLIWFLEKNEYPKMIDHMDGNGLNNKISNLRSVDNRTNQRNRNVHRKGQLPGLHFCKITNKWRAQTTIKGRRIHLGRFDTQQEAYETTLAYLKNRDQL